MVCMFLSLQMLHIKHSGISPLLCLPKFFFHHAKRSRLNSTSPNLAQIDIKLVSTTLVPFCSVEISGLQTPHSTFTYNTKPKLLCHASSSCQKFPQRGGPSEKVSCGGALTLHILSMEKTSHPLISTLCSSF